VNKRELRAPKSLIRSGGKHEAAETESG
jgi:hypothetical protein